MHSKLTKNIIMIGAQFLSIIQTDFACGFTSFTHMSSKSNSIELNSSQITSSLIQPLNRTDLFKKSHQVIGLLSLIGVISLWLTASILTHDILKEYNKPVLMTFLSVISMQIYFVFLKIKDPLHDYLEVNTTSQVA